MMRVIRLVGQMQERACLFGGNYVNSLNKMKWVQLTAILLNFFIGCKKGGIFGGGVPEEFSSVVELRDQDGAPLSRPNLMTTDSSGNIYVINDHDDDKAMYQPHFDSWTFIGRSRPRC